MGPVTLLIFLRRVPTRLQNHGSIFGVQVPNLKKTVKSPGNISATEKKSRRSKTESNSDYSLLKATEEPTKIRRIEVKLSEGYYVTMIPVWQLLDEQGNAKEISLEPQKSSGRRPWRRCFMEEMVNKNGTNVIRSLS